MTAADLGALDKLRGAATPGEWNTDGAPDRGVWVGRLVRDSRLVASCEKTDDAALIVAAVNALPDLIAALRRVEAIAERLDRGGYRVFAADLREALASQTEQ